MAKLVCLHIGRSKKNMIKNEINISLCSQDLLRFENSSKLWLQAYYSLIFVNLDKFENKLSMTQL